MKKKLPIILIILMMTAFSVYPYFVTIGRLSGIENEKVMITKGKYAGEYILSDCSHCADDRGRIIGNLEGGYFDYYVYKTSCEEGCIYVASSGQGSYYMPAAAQ